MLVSIILPTIRAMSVGVAIEAILRQTDGNWELIVVPQGDDQKLMELLSSYEQHDHRIRVVHADRMNVSHARNVGIEAATGEILALTDDDCEAEPDWIAVARELFAANPDVGILGGEVVAPPSVQRWRISTCPAAHVIDAKYQPSMSNHHAPPGFYMISANICLRRAVAERVGNFDTVFGAGARYGACEDQDFLFRAEALDIGFMTSTRLRVVHTTGRRYGMRSFIKHQRNYARGRGAWTIKLQMWGHRVGDEYATMPTIREHVKLALTRPHRWLFELFAWQYKKQGSSEYCARYELGPDLLSHPKQAL